MRSRSLVIALVLGALAAFPASAAAAVPITVFVISGFECVSGTGPRNTEVIATLRTPSGHLRGRFLAESDDDGNWSGCFSGGINGHDRLRIVAGSRERTIVVPRVQPEINRVDDTISGEAPAGSLVVAQISHRRTFIKSSSHFLEMQANGQGRYTFDTTGEVNLKGGDAVIVLTQVGNDTFGALVVAPHINVLHANNIANGTANNGTDLILELRDRDGNLKADVTAGSSALFIGISFWTVNLFDDDGNAVYPVGGDELDVTLADDATLRIPVSSLRGNAATDVVTGRCMANAPFGLLAGDATFYGRTDANGHLTRDVGNRTNLRRGDQLQLICLYPTGDTWTRTAIAL